MAKTDAVKTEVSKRRTDFPALVKKIRKSKPRSRDLAALRRELARDPDLWRRYGDFSTVAVEVIIYDAVKAATGGGLDVIGFVEAKALAGKAAEVLLVELPAGVKALLGAKKRECADARR